MPRTPSQSDKVLDAAQPSVDVGIITIREDEFRAVLAAFPVNALPENGGVVRGRREYNLRWAEAGSGARYCVAILRQVEQGNGEAQAAASALLDDLEPKLLLVVGIAGGLPSGEFTLGDVVLSTRVNDYSVEARKEGAEPTYSLSGGPVDMQLAAAIVNLPAREADLGDWTQGLPERPRVKWDAPGQLYGPPEWQEELCERLKRHFGEGSTPRFPVYKDGVIASSDMLVKDPNVLFPWLQTARHLLAVEMESGGVYRAARGRCPMLAIRGISDIVGLVRSDDWTQYACLSAAAFARAYLRTTPVPLIRSTASVGGTGKPTLEQETAEQTSLRTLVPSRQPVDQGQTPRPLEGEPAVQKQPLSRKQIFARWSMAIVVMILGITLTITIVGAIEPTYRSEAVLEFRGGTGGTELVPGAPEIPRLPWEKLREWLLDRLTLEKVVNEFNLYPEIVEKRGMLPAVDRLRRSIMFEQRQVDIIAISSTGKTREEAQEVTQRLADVLVEMETRARLDGVRKTVELLRDAAQHAKEELGRANNAMQQFRAAHPRFAPERAQSGDLVTEWERLKHALESSKQRLSEAESKLSRAEMLASTGKAGHAAQLALLSPAYRPAAPSSIPRVSLFFMGLIASVGLGLVFVAAHKRLSRWR
ncbi:phosphorylase family protein [Sorangium sp. So ce861]|uniref:5'-methylthioadenosine/S-adenosylhomocysteine nucleosidase family protein n=1 Tax=Sorangium sp. So ce861 TaxID=3133323 RepID=UPI003F5EB349